MDGVLRAGVRDGACGGGEGGWVGGWREQTKLEGCVLKLRLMGERAAFGALLVRVSEPAGDETGDEMCCVRDVTGM